MGSLARALDKIPLLNDLIYYLRMRRKGVWRRELYPRGHFYSPLPDEREVRAQAATLYDNELKTSPAIQDWSTAQRATLEAIAAHYAQFAWQAGAVQGARFSFDQPYFGPADALALYGMLRVHQPARVVEVGSGHSSALMLDVNERFLARATQLTFIEPHPERLNSVLRAEDNAQARVRVECVQATPFSVFEELQAGDFLFIDSSHIARPGSDLNHLLFNVIPRLAPGVIIHFHDIFWPFEYPLAWIEEGRAYNELYLLRAFLAYNPAFEILLFNHHAGHAERAWLEQRMPLFLRNTGGSLWLRKLAMEV